MYPFSTTKIGGVWACALHRPLLFGTAGLSAYIRASRETFRDSVPLQQGRPSTVAPLAPHHDRPGGQALRVTACRRDATPPCRWYGCTCRDAQTPFAWRRCHQHRLHRATQRNLPCNNAGITSDKTFQKMDHTAWQRVMATHLDGVFNCTKLFVDHMIERSWGRIVNNHVGDWANWQLWTSQLCRFQGCRCSFYQVIGQGSRSERDHRERRGPRLHCHGQMTNIPEKIQAKLLEQIPMRRFGYVEEVARRPTAGMLRRLRTYAKQCWVPLRTISTLPPKRSV